MPPPASTTTSPSTASSQRRKMNMLRQSAAVPLDQPPPRRKACPPHHPPPVDRELPSPTLRPGPACPPPPPTTTSTLMTVSIPKTPISTPIPHICEFWPPFPPCLSVYHSDAVPRSGPEFSFFGSASAVCFFWLSFLLLYFVSDLFQYFVFHPFCFRFGMGVVCSGSSVSRSVTPPSP